MYRLPFVECLMFGALISATDPVTVLSIFQVMLHSSSVVSSTFMSPLASTILEYIMFIFVELKPCGNYWASGTVQVIKISSSDGNPSMAIPFC